MDHLVAFLRWTPQILAALHDGPVPFSPALAPRLAAFNPGGIDGSVEVAPTTLDTNAGLIDTPGPVGWFEMTAQPLLQFGTVTLDPAPDCRGVRLQAALTEQLFDITERERVPKGPARGAKHQFGPRLSPLEDRRSDCLFHDLFRLPAVAGQSCNTTVDTP